MSGAGPLALREWAPLNALLKQIPPKAQKGLQTLDLKLTCVAAAEEGFIALGTNVGLVYWYNQSNHVLERLKTGNTCSGITTLGLVSTVEFMLAAANKEGYLTIFQIPKSSVLQSVKRFDLVGVHFCTISALEWSNNGMKLFSGDVSGSVVLTEVDFETDTVKSQCIVDEKHEIVQLSYTRKYLLICSTLQSVIYSLEFGTISKVGTQDRKIKGKFGGLFRKNAFNEPPKVYSVRPGGRLWIADTNGMVESTIKFKDLLLQKDYTNIPLINPSISSNDKTFQDFQIGFLARFGNYALVTFHKQNLYILDPVDTRILGICREFKGILDVAVTSQDIYILESDRNLIRLSSFPEAQSFIPPSTNEGPEFLKNILMATSVAEFRQEMEQPLNYLSSKIKETSKFSKNLVPKLTLKSNLIVSTIKQVIEADANVVDGTTTFCDRSPEVSEEASESYEAQNLEQGPHKFEHISQLPFDDVLLVPPKVRKKFKTQKKQGKKKLEKMFQSSGDTVSMSSSTYSTNSEDDNILSKSVENLQKTNSSFSIVLNMSNSWCVGQGQSQPENQDLEAKEEILARKLNWPELLPESAREKFELEIELQKFQEKLTNIEENGSSIVLTLNEAKAVDDNSSLEKEVEEEKVSSIFEESIDIYTKYGPKADQPVSFGPPSSSLTSTNSNNPSILTEPKIIEIDESALSTSPDSVLELIPVRDMLVEPIQIGQGNDSWISYLVPAPLQCIAACEQYVVATDRRNQVYISELNSSSNLSSNLRWIQAKYSASQISVSSCGSVFWRLNKGFLYSLMNPDPSSNLIEGGSWSKICSNVVSMSIQRHVGWIVKSDGSVWNCSGLLSTAVVPDFEKIWSPSSIQICKIVAQEFKVWALSVDGRIFFRDGITEDQIQGGGWIEKKFECPLSSAPTSLAFGPADSLWIGDEKNCLYYVDGLSESCYEGKPYNWKITLGGGEFMIPGKNRNSNSNSGSSSSSSKLLNSLKSKLSDSFRPEKITSLLQSKYEPILAGTGTSVWFSFGGSSTIYVNRRKAEGHRWVGTKAIRLLKQNTWEEVAAGSIYKDHGVLWLLDPKGKLFNCKRSGGEAKAIDLPCSSTLVCVVPAPDALWILNKDGGLFGRCNLGEGNPIGYGWSPINLSSQEGLHLVHVSCGSDVAWGVDIKGDVYMRVGSLRPNGPQDMSPPWVNVEDEPSLAFTNVAFTKVYVGTIGSMVWALDARNNIYVREAVFPDFPIGTRWLLVSGIEAVALALSEEAVWALSPKGEIFRRFGISDHNFVGDYWKQIPGPGDTPVKNISASLCDEVWAVDCHGVLMKHSHQILEFKSSWSPPGPKMVLDSEFKDWVVVDSL